MFSLTKVLLLPAAQPFPKGLSDVNDLNVSLLMRVAENLRMKAKMKGIGMCHMSFSALSSHLQASGLQNVLGFECQARTEHLQVLEVFLFYCSGSDTLHGNRNYT